MGRKKISIIVGCICIGLIVALVGISLNSNSKPIHDIKTFESINIAARPEYAIKDFEIIDYSGDEGRIRKFLTDFMEFITEEYEYTKDFKTDLKFKYKNYFTQLSPNATSNYRYIVDFYKEDEKVFLRGAVTDIFKMLNMKLTGSPNIKILSKEEKKLNYVDKFGYCYTVLMAIPVEINKKNSEDDILKNYGGDRINTTEYLEFSIFDYDDELKIHTIEKRNNDEGINAFLSSLSENSENKISTVDSVIEKVRYESEKVNKYIVDSSESTTDFSSIADLTEEEIKSISNKNIDSVVIIMNLDSNNKVQSLGTGFFLQPGIILTNCHVISGAAGLKVIMHDGKECEVDGIVSANGTIDLAIIKLAKEIGRGVIFSNDISNIANNEPVVAIGHPYGNYYTITAGVFDKLINNSNVLFFQSALPLAPGNSGGPLFDKDGNVIGVNTAIDNVGDTTLSVPYTYIENLIDILSSTKFSEISSLKEI